LSAIQVARAAVLSVAAQLYFRGILSPEIQAPVTAIMEAVREAALSVLGMAQ
jgi:hypothetical protein